MSKRKYKNIAKVVMFYRNKMELSQNDLAWDLGYKNGQYISNIERGLCSIPAKKIYALSNLLQCQPYEIVEAVLKDESEYIWKVFEREKRDKKFYTLPPIPRILSEKQTN